MEATLHTGGEIVAIRCDDARLATLLSDGANGELAPASRSGSTLSVVVERERSPFSTSGWTPLARNAWHRHGEVVVRDACTSGFDLHARVVGDAPELTFRWRPPAATRAAGTVLPARARLLARSVLLQYPVLWWAGTRERVPLHASLVRTGGHDIAVGGPSGAGKSTLVATEVAAGARAAGDNLCVTDGRTAWGIVEPIRVEGASGRRMPHGRRECRLVGRVPALVPDLVALLRRRADGLTVVAPLSSRAAGRELAAGTYTAGELRRFWPFAALLGLGTGAGPVHPPVAAVSRVLADRVATYAVALAPGPAGRLVPLLQSEEALSA